jgi:trk system potassium uptake protein TrkA
VATFEDTDAEAIELEVAPQSAAADRRIVDLDLPSGAIIGGVLRNGDSFVPSGLTEIEAGDRLIIFALPKALATVEALFAE